MNLLEQYGYTKKVCKCGNDKYIIYVDEIWRLSYCSECGEREQ